MRRWTSPLLLYPLAALVLLGISAVLYWLPWVSSREALVDDEGLRVLAAMGDQLGRRLVDIVQVFRAARKTPNPDLYLHFQAPWLTLRGVCMRPTAESSVLLSVAANEGLYDFQLTQGTCQGSTKVKDILDSIKPPESPFESLLLADSDGLVLFESGRTGLRIADVAALLESGTPAVADKNSEPEWYIRSRNFGSVRTIRLAGGTYRLYLMPVSVGLPWSGSHGGGTQLALGALIRQSAFRTLAVSQSGTFFIWVVLVAMILIWGFWPLLKFTQMGRQDRIPRGSGILLIFSTAASAALATLLILHGTHFAFDQITETQLRALAKRIDDNATLELRRALQSIDLAERSREFGKPASPAATRTDMLSFTPYLYESDPFLDQLMWADKQGNELVKWTALHVGTPDTDLSTYPFFEEAIHGNLWSFDCAPDDGCSQRPFRVDPLYARNSGTYIAVLSTPAHEAAAKKGYALTVAATRLASLIDPVVPTDFGFAVIDRDGSILFHSTPGPNVGREFSSDFRPANLVRAALESRTPLTLPAAYQGTPHTLYLTHFAQLLNCPWTLVLFHRDSAKTAKHIDRMLLFFVLTAFYGAAAGVLALVLRLRQQDYPSRTFWPLDERRGEYVQIAISLAVISGSSLYWALEGDFSLSVLLSAVAGLAGFPLIWLRLRGYSAPIFVLSLALFLGALHWWESNGIRLVLISGACALLAARPVSFALQRSTAYFGLAVCYSAAGAAFIWSSAIAPCIGFYKVATDFEEVKFTMRDQLHTLAALEQRAHHIQERYASVQVSDGSFGSGTDAVLNALFIRERLFMQNILTSGTSGPAWDRHDNMSDSKWKRAEREVWEDKSWSIIQKLADLIRIVPNPEAEEARNLGIESGPSWSFEGPARVRLIRSPTNSPILSFTSDESDYVPDSLVMEYKPLKSLFWYAWVLLVLLGIGIFFLLLSSLRRLFLLDVNVPQPWPVLRAPEFASAGQDLIAIGLPHTGKTESATACPGYTVLDVNEFLRGRIAAPPEARRLIIVDHFERAFDSAERADKVLELLEKLVGSHRRVILVTTSDPWFVLENNETFRPRLDRWAAVLARFMTVSFETGTFPTGERGFEVIWGSCSLLERIVLFQLAKDGWANYRNQAGLIHLSRRGLVVHDHTFRIREESIRDGLLGRVPEQEIRNWSRQEGASTWGGLRAALAIAAIGIAVLFFLYAQQQVLAIITGGLPALASGLRVIAEFKGRKTRPEVPAA